MNFASGNLTDLYWVVYEVIILSAYSNKSIAYFLFICYSIQDL